MAKKRIPDPRQLPLFIPTSEWRPPTQLPTHLINAPYFALDTETSDPGLRELGPSWFRGGGHLAGISLAWPGGKVYLPIRHAGGDNMDPDQVLGWLRHLLQNYKGTVVMMNAIYDLGWCRTDNIHLGPKLTLHDVMMVEALLDEHRIRYNLNSLAESYKLEQKDERELNDAADKYGLDPKADIAKLPARFVGRYAEKDAELTLQIYEHQLPKIQQQRLEKVVQLEHELVPLHLEMRWRGVRVDMAGAERLHAEFMGNHEEARRSIQSLTGYLPDVWSADSCAVVMDKMNIKYKKTATGKPSFTDDWLSTFPANTVPWFIGKARKEYKAAQTFCRGMVLDHADPAGRIHPEFHPLRSDDGGTVSGRYSSSNPGLNVPGRDPRMGTLIRGLFLPEEGEQWCAADWSQQEPRLTVHYAVINECTRALEVAERYRSDANTDYHDFTAELAFGKNFTPKHRKQAKTINLGRTYGMGGAKLCRQLGLPTKTMVNRAGREIEIAGDEGQSILDQYDSELPFIKELSNRYTDIANEVGEIRTLSGRLCRFPFFEPKNGGRALLFPEAVQAYGNNIKRAYTYKALNRKIQGGGADLMKITMRNLFREGIVPLLTIHDEVGASVKSQKDAFRIAEIMRDCVKLEVPMKVDVDLGENWGAAKPVQEDEA